MIKQDMPFKNLFSFTSPKDFVFKFRNETPQTMAFLLSFSPKKSYIRKVIRLLNDKEKEIEDQNKKTHIIQEYLNHSHEHSFDENFIKMIEDEVLKMTVPG